MDKRSGYVSVVRDYFRGKIAPKTIRDLQKDLPQFTASQISSALNYLCRGGILDRFITEYPRDGTPYTNVWHYMRSKKYYKKVKIYKELKIISKKKPVTIRKTGRKNELQKSKVTRNPKNISMPDVRS